MAAEACAIVDQIRFEEQQTLWTKEFEDSLVDQNIDVYTGMMFSLAKDRMEKSKLWKIIRRMPKGTLLHCHLEAMIDLDWALEEAFATEGVCIQSDEPLSSPEALKRANFGFTYTKATANSEVSIWTDQYNPNTPVPLTVAAEKFDGSREGFCDWVRSRCTITAEEHLAHHKGPNEIWRKFMSCFPILGSLMFYEPIFRKFLRRMFKQLLDDGVYYVDMRAVFVTPFRSFGEEEYDPDHIGMLNAMEEEIENFKNSEEGKGFWGARLIWTTIRQFGTKNVIEGKSSIYVPQMVRGLRRGATRSFHHFA
jgi:adenosine deaminase CECR1